MSKTIEEINLESYSIEELNTLIEMAKKELSQRDQARLQNIRTQMERLASSVGMTVEELISSEDVIDMAGASQENKKMKIKFRNPANPAQTWSGRGKRPRWLQEALDKGASLGDFAVSG